MLTVIDYFDHLKYGVNFYLLILIQHKMGFEDIFENRDRYNEHYREERYPDHGRYSGNSRYSSHGEGDQFNWLIILEKIKSNKKLRILVFLAGLLVLTVAIVLIVVLLPLIIKLINSISQTGLQGIVNDITEFIDKILKGTAN
jgi:hypothetical protein